jgi:hypothetical protein
MADNHVQIAQGFRILLGAFAPYIAQELKNHYKEHWWQTAVIDALYDEQKRDLPSSGDEKTLVGSLDIQRCLLLFDINWNTIFRKKLSVDHRTWAKELAGVRNRLAHLGSEDFSIDDTWRALDTLSRLCEQIDPESAEKIRGLLRTLRYGSEDGSRTIEHTFGRMESVWKPVAANEGFEVVRRRLFLDCKNPEGRDGLIAPVSGAMSSGSRRRSSVTCLR